MLRFFFLIGYSRKFATEIRGFDPPARWAMRARRAPRCHWMLPANFRARTSVRRPIPLPLSAISLPPGRGAIHPTSKLTPLAPTPALRASSIIFVQAREPQSRYGGERVTGVTGWPGGSLGKRETRIFVRRALGQARNSHLNSECLTFVHVYLNWYAYFLAFI